MTDHARMEQSFDSTAHDAPVVPGRSFPPPVRSGAIDDADPPTPATHRAQEAVAHAAT